MSSVIPTKMDPKLVDRLDELVAQGVYLSRSEAIRDAVRRVVEDHVSESVPLLSIGQAAVFLLEDRLGGRLTDVILFGSVAEGTASKESDIDLLLVIPDQEDRFKVLLEAQDAVYPLALAFGVQVTTVIMGKGTFRDLYEEGFSFAREVTEKGVQMRGGILDEFRE
jgi:predicted nucleotidyltransferase